MQEVQFSYADASDPLVKRMAIGAVEAAVGQLHLKRLYLDMLAHGEPLAAPAVLLSGGETTVTMGHGPAGHGGRNTEFLLGLAVALDGAPGIWGVAGDNSSAKPLELGELSNRREKYQESLMVGLME